MNGIIAFALALILALPAAAAPVDLHDNAGEKVLNGILSGNAFWSGASTSHHNGKLYDEIRLKQTDGGYIPMITGQGGQDYGNDVVSDVVFTQNTRLPMHMSGAKAIVGLGSGYDSAVGAAYRDSFYVLDLTVMYVVFPQRMYRHHDAVTGQTVLSFEKIDASFVDVATWASYNKTMDATVDGMSRRMLMNSVVEATEVYGMFVVEPGEDFESRVTFVSKIGFDESAGWMARLGSQLPPVLRSGLKSGFNASVTLAGEEKQKRNRGVGP